METVFHSGAERGRASHGWLESRHTFSFGSYRDPQRMGFGVLRVINDDIIEPSTGFDTHHHESMEIISIPLTGALRHKDTLGNEFVIRQGEVQLMSAGSGISHSEYNDSDTEKANFLQIWVHPCEKGTPPGYQQREFPLEERMNRIQTVVAPEHESALKIRQNAYFSLASFDPGFGLKYSLHDSSSGLYIFAINGEITAATQKMEARDGVGLVGVEEVFLQALSAADVLLMEVPLA